MPSCNRCGTRLEPNGEYCSFCGTAVASDAAPPPNPWQRRLAQPRPAPDLQEAGSAAAPLAAPTAVATPPEVQILPQQAHPAPRVVVPQPAPPRLEQPRPRSTTAPIDALPLIRLLAALAVLAISITSYIAAKMHNPPAWLVKWGLLELPPKSVPAYQAEMIILILLAVLAIAIFLARSDASQGLALLLGLAVMGIVTGNILNLPFSHQIITYGMVQTGFITTWICLGLAFISGSSVIWSDATPRRVGALVAAGAVVTGGTVAIISAIAPTLPTIPAG